MLDDVGVVLGGGWEGLKTKIDSKLAKKKKGVFLVLIRKYKNNPDVVSMFHHNIDK
jgi:hypothetical protein